MGLQPETHTRTLLRITPPPNPKPVFLGSFCTISRCDNNPVGPKEGANPPFLALGQDNSGPSTGVPHWKVAFFEKLIFHRTHFFGLKGLEFRLLTYMTIAGYIFWALLGTNISI